MVLPAMRGAGVKVLKRGEKVERWGQGGGQQTRRNRKRRGVVREAVIREKDDPCECPMCYGLKVDPETRERCAGCDGEGVLTADILRG